MNETVAKHLFDRRLFMTAAIAFPLIVLAGFGRTYYVNGLFDVPPLASRLVHVHGLLMTTWVALFGTQVCFISSKQIRLHQRVGYAGIGLGAVIVAVGSVTALNEAAGVGNPRDLNDMVSVTVDSLINDPSLAARLRQ